MTDEERAQRRVTAVQVKLHHSSQQTLKFSFPKLKLNSQQGALPLGEQNLTTLSLL